MPLPTLPAAPDHVRPTTSLLKALADDNRLRIVALLARGELCVCHIAEALSLSQPNVSQHLNVLKNAGVVDYERRGSWMYHRLAAEPDPGRARILAAVLEGVADLAPADTERLVAAKASVPCE
jgi:ArsR family transcriptional regulator